jgi:hypothetical protein
MPTKLTTATLNRASAFVAPEVEALRPGIVADLAEADRTLRRLTKERAAEADPARRAELLAGVDAAEAVLVRLRKEANQDNRDGGSLDVAAHAHIKALVDKAPPLSESTLAHLATIFRSVEAENERGTGRCLHCQERHGL